MHNLYINYGSESTDAAMSMAGHLKSEKYLGKTPDKQLDLIEESIIRHGKGKLRKWQSNVDVEDSDALKEWQSNVDIENINTLEETLATIKTFLDLRTNNNKDTINAYFNQYIHAIVYTLGKIRGQISQIKWDPEKDYSPIDEDVVFEEKDGELKNIITKKDIESYVLIKKILDAYKEKYINNENIIPSNNTKPYVKSYSAKPSVMSFGYQYTKKYPKK